MWNIFIPETCTSSRFLFHNTPNQYEVCSKNTRTQVIKMYFIWKLHVRVPFKVLFSPTHTLLPTVFLLLQTVLIRFFCDDFHLLRRICLNFRNRHKSSSFWGLFKFWEREKVTRSKVRWVEGMGTEQLSSVWPKTHEFWVLSGVEHCRDGKSSCHFSTILALWVEQRPQTFQYFSCVARKYLMALVR